MLIQTPNNNVCSLHPQYSVDLSAVSSLLQKTFADLKVDPKNYHVQLSVPRVLNTNTQAELLRVLFEKFGVRSVNLTHQSILALYAYNATSGIVVDIGERMDIVPVIDGEKLLKRGFDE